MNPTASPSEDLSASSLEEVSCPVCPDARKQLVYQVPAADGNLRSIVSCSDCGLIFVSPRIASEKIAATYSGKEYFERNDDRTGYQNYLQDRELHLIFFRRQLAELENRLPGRKLLDVGCAGGFLIHEAVHRGWQAEGVELSSFASAYARDTLGLNVRTGSLRESDFAANSFDAVVMDDVIEHFENPLTEVREVYRILKPGGGFLLHTPNAGSPWRTFMGKKWIHLKPDEHLFYFDPSTIDTLLSKAGFEFVYARGCSKATNLAYIVGVLEKSIPAVARLVKKMFAGSKWWENPFPFRGGGMQIYAVKPASAS